MHLEMIGTYLINPQEKIYQHLFFVKYVHFQLYIRKKTVSSKSLKMKRIFGTFDSLSLAIFNDVPTRSFFRKLLEHTHLPYFRAKVEVFSLY